MFLPAGHLRAQPFPTCTSQLSLPPTKYTFYFLSTSQWCNQVYPFSEPILGILLANYTPVCEILPDTGLATSCCREDRLWRPFLRPGCCFAILSAALENGSLFVLGGVLMDCERWGEDLRSTAFLICLNSGLRFESMPLAESWDVEANSMHRIGYQLELSE